MKIKLSDLVNSQFRNFAINPLREEKIVALVESIGTTGFWKNIVVRDLGNKFEIVFGHHRVAALRRANSASSEFDFNVVKLTDAEVLQRMSRDHSDVFNHDLAGVVELVRATVNAVALECVTLENIPKNADRNAPSFVAGNLPDSGKFRYTVLSIAAFLGLTRRAGKQANTDVETSFKVLELFERHIWNEKEAKSYFYNPDGSPLSKEKIEAAAREALKRQQERAARRQQEAQSAVEKHDKAITNLQEQKQQAEKDRLAAIERERAAKARVKQAETPSQEKKAEDAAEAARKKAEAAEREKEKLNERIKYKKEQKERAAKAEREREEKKRGEENTRFVNGVLDSIDRLYDRTSLVHVNVHNLSAKNSIASPKDIEKIRQALVNLVERVSVDVQKLKERK